ncbi:MAG TPA: hypothetical protein VK563_01145 [Puia sp.]|nr:hypothetical protein [Puia sp.]
MSSQTILQLCLVAHISGFTIMAGTVIADFSVIRRMKKYLFTDKPKALAILEGSAAFPALIGAGAALLITTGLGMAFIFKAAVTSMLWFRIKMVLVLLVLINGIAIARPTLIKLRGLLAQTPAAGDRPIEGIIGRLRIIYVAQLIMFLTIFVLSVFRF